MKQATDYMPLALPVSAAIAKRVMLASTLVLMAMACHPSNSTHTVYLTNNSTDATVTLWMQDSVYTAPRSTYRMFLLSSEAESVSFEAVMVRQDGDTVYPRTGHGRIRNTLPLNRNWLWSFGGGGRSAYDLWMMDDGDSTYNAARP